MKGFAVVHETDVPRRIAPLRDRDGAVSSFTAMVDEFFPVGDATLELKRVTLPPAAVVVPHEHDSAEILYVLDGSIVFGAHRCVPGSAVYVGANTRYGFVAGPDGCTFVNFRGVVGTSIVYPHDANPTSEVGAP
ncbi:MAG TPA: hypothetical protein VNO51_20130 [Ilumatobacteraceae bacterium]|nr:hypothetical protein [Ilumatobacteraceae bacterium]